MALGYKHPKHLLDALTAEEWADWRAYAEVEQFGERWMHRALGILGARLLNALTTRKDGRSFSPEDILPWLEESPDVDLIDLSPDEQVAAFDRLFK